VQPPPLGDYRPPLDSGLAIQKDANVSCKVQTPEQGVCDCVEVGLLTDVPNIVFVLDRSGSMAENNKWETVRTVVAKAVSALGPRIRVSVTIFPSAANGCSTGAETLSLRQGDTAPMGGLSQTGNDVLGATYIAPNGGTPTAATLLAMAPKLTSLSGRTFVVLATDGGPNCNAKASCDATQCIPNIENSPAFCTGSVNCCSSQYYGPLNCLDSQPTIDAVAALAAAMVPTFVIGVPGSGPYAALLDALASSGGTARASEPYYYRVDGTDPSQFASTLGKIAAKISATCTFPLAKIPDDPGLINVFLDGAPLVHEPVDGWTLWGSVVTLMGKSCDRVLSGDVLQVRVVEGCPTINPN